MAAAAADDLSDDGLDAGVEAAIDLPPSSIWLSKLTWRNRLTERMRSNDEWEDFKDNIGNFQGGGTITGEADNYSGIRLSDSLQVGTTGSILLGIPSQQWRTKVQAICKGLINL